MSGVFAYYLIKRGHTHRLRIVGTLKSEPAISFCLVLKVAYRLPPGFGAPRARTTLCLST
jgi:hypothetical protein